MPHKREVVGPDPHYSNLIKAMEVAHRRNPNTEETEVSL